MTTSHFHLRMLSLQECFKTKLHVKRPAEPNTGEPTPLTRPFEVASDEQLASTLNAIRAAETALRLLTPFAPYLSEELWQRIPKHLLGWDFPESVTVAPYPTVENVSRGCSSSA